MSEAQLQKILADNNRLRDEVEFTKNIAKVSVSCGALQKFTEETNDPFINPVNTPDNPNMWLETKSTGCVLL